MLSSAIYYLIYTYFILNNSSNRAILLLLISIWWLANYTMTDFINTNDKDISITSSRSELRTTALVVLARIVAKAYLRKTTADKNSVSEITLPNSQRNSVNGIGKGNGVQL